MTCRFCDKKLRRDTYAPEGVGVGYNGDGRFCSLRCGWRWANAIITSLDSGAYRLVKVKST